MAGETSKVVDLTGKMVLDPVPLADWLVVAPVAIPIVAGAVFLMLRHETKLHGWLALIALTATLAANIGLLARILENGPVVMTMGRWLPPFGISFTADTLGASMSLVATLVAAACGIYSIIDIGSVGRRYGFYAFMLVKVFISFKIYRKSGGIKGKDVRLVKKNTKLENDLEEQAVAAARAL